MDMITALENQGNSKKEAETLYGEIRTELYEMIERGEDPSNLLYDYGLEDDYFFDLL